MHPEVGSYADKKYFILTAYKSDGDLAELQEIAANIDRKYSTAIDLEKNEVKKLDLYIPVSLAVKALKSYKLKKNK